MMHCIFFGKKVIFARRVDGLVIMSIVCIYFLIPYKC